MNWFIASVFSFLSFGLWGLFSKISVLHIDAKSALIFQTLGVMIIGLFTLTLVDFKPTTEIRGLSFAIITGLAYGIGCLFYFVAASKGKIVTVVTLTALYPLVTIVLSYIFLKEVVTLRQCMGIGLALVAITLMSL